MPSKSTLFWRGVGHHLPGGVFGSIIRKRHLPVVYEGVLYLQHTYASEGVWIEKLSTMR